MTNQSVDYLTLGPTPCEEDCAQVGTDDYSTRALPECRRFKEQLKRQFPIPVGVYAYFTVKAFPHEFGTYHEVCIVFDDTDEEAIEFAYRVDYQLPSHWDGQVSLSLE